MQIINQNKIMSTFGNPRAQIVKIKWFIFYMHVCVFYILYIFT